MARNMDVTEEIGETPHSRKNNSSRSMRSSFDSADSGYLSFTPQSNKYGSAYCSKSSIYSARKLHRSQIEPYPSKLKRKLNTSEFNASGSFAKDTLGSIAHTPTNDFSNITPMLGESKVEQPRRTCTMELRSHWKKQHQPSTSSATPAHSHSFRDYLSLSPISAVPLSPIAAKPTDAEMNLVIQQSTPCIFSSPILPTSLHNAAFSPISYKASPHVGSANSKKFSNLSISECVTVSKKSKPKRLDFSKRAIFASFQRQRATPDFTGKETVDIFKLLGEKSNHPRVVSKILGYLSPQDLCSVSMVSKSWHRICGNDAKAQERRLKHVILRQCSKENFVSISKLKLEEQIQMSPKTRYPRRGFLTVVPTNLLEVPKLHITPSSPPVSPSKVIFHSFIKAGRSLAPRDQLVPCPQCKFACRVEHEKNVGMCSRKGCPMEEFCVLCSSKVHAGEPCKMPLLATPTKRGKQQQHIVGTKQCKRNLRRISRLV